MPEIPSFPHPESPSPDVRSFAVDMSRNDIANTTKGLNPGQRVAFWSTFESRDGMVSPSSVTGDSRDDIAAVLSGSKPATILTPEEFFNRPVDELAIAASEQYDQLSLTRATDDFGVRLLFLGQEENAKALAELYEGRGDVSRPITEEFHRKVGEMLGYPEDAIEKFVGEWAGRSKRRNKQQRTYVPRLRKLLGKLGTRASQKKS